MATGAGSIWLGKGVIMKTNNTRIMLKLGAVILSAVLTLLGVAMLAGCATIRTLPGIGAALTPAWDEATLAGRKGHTA